MKAILCLIVLLGLFASPLYATDLQRVEQLTESERQELKAAKKAIDAANLAYKNVVDNIAKNHNMKSETWMEWRTWYEINGDFILLYGQSHMRGWTIR